MITTKMEVIADHEPYQLKKGDTVVVYDVVMNVNSSLDPGIKVFFLFFSLIKNDWAFIHASHLRPYQGVTLTVPRPN